MLWVHYGKGIAFGLVKGPNARKATLWVAFLFWAETDLMVGHYKHKRVTGGSIDGRCGVTLYSRITL